MLTFMAPSKLPLIVYGFSYFDVKLRVGLKKDISSLLPQLLLTSFPNLQVSLLL